MGEKSVLEKENADVLTWNIFSKYRTVLLGCAIMGIVFCHLDIAQTHSGMPVSRLASVLHVFTAFVDVFLFLSGLGLYYSMRENPNRSYRDFLKRRVEKIVPSYLILSGITYVIWIIIMNHGTVWQVLKNISFVSWVLTGSTKYWFVLAVLCFYIVFPLLYQYIYKDEYALYRLLIMLFCYIVVTGVFHKCFDSYSMFMIAIERFPVFMWGGVLRETSI